MKIIDEIKYRLEMLGLWLGMALCVLAIIFLCLIPILFIVIMVVAGSKLLLLLLAL